MGIATNQGEGGNKREGKATELRRTLGLGGSKIFWGGLKSQE